MSHYVFKRITADDAMSAATIEDLAAEYGTEITYPGLKPEVDWDAYRRLSAAGVLSVVGVYKDDKLVGFASYIKTQSPHFKGQTIAASDSLFVRADCRDGSLGLRLIRAAEMYAKSEGCLGYVWSAKVGSTAAKLFERIATPNNIFFWKPL